MGEWKNAAEQDGANAVVRVLQEEQYDNTPMLEQAAAQVASSLNITASANRAVVGSGSSPYGDMVNGMLQGITAINNGSIPLLRSIWYNNNGNTLHHR